MKLCCIPVELTQAMIDNFWAESKRESTGDWIFNGDSCVTRAIKAVIADAPPPPVEIATALHVAANTVRSKMALEDASNNEIILARALLKSWGKE